MTSTRSRTGNDGEVVINHRAAAANRFEAKRLEHERRAGLRRLRLVLALTVVTSLAVGTIAFINSTWFDVDSIAVIGNDRADPEEIIEASGIELGQGLHEVNRGGAVAGIVLVPWVGSATVERGWTGEIVISVEERPPSAALPAGNRFALVDEHGRQLEIVTVRPDGYVPILGIESSGVAGEPAPTDALPVIALLGALPPEMARQVASVTVADRHLYLDLSIGGRVDFGDGSDLAQKLQTAETMLARVDLRCLDTIDVRVPSAPVVTRLVDLDAAEPIGGETGDQTGDESSGGDLTQSEAGEEPDSVGPDC